jgi:hypothetical protein
MESLEMIKVDY